MVKGGEKKNSGYSAFDESFEFAMKAGKCDIHHETTKGQSGVAQETRPGYDQTLNL